MHPYTPLTALMVLAALSGQVAPALAPPETYDRKFVATDTITGSPTREKPQVLEGRLTLGGNIPTQDQAPGAGNPLRNYLVYHLIVPPGTKLKAQLKGSPRDFRVQFLSSTMGRIPDPGLNVNQIMKRQDVAFYENRTETAKTIYCLVKALEPMADRPFAVVFTDF